MLRLLGIRSDLEYYACEDEFDYEAVTEGKRRRWTATAKLNRTIEDVVFDPEILEDMRRDHAYNKDDGIEKEDDLSVEAVDFKMGEDYFMDSQSISCVEETVTEDNTDARMFEGTQHQQVENKFKVMNILVYKIHIEMRLYV